MKNLFKKFLPLAAGLALLMSCNDNDNRYDFVLSMGGYAVQYNDGDTEPAGFGPYVLVVSPYYYLQSVTFGDAVGGNFYRGITGPNFYELVPESNREYSLTSINKTYTASAVSTEDETAQLSFTLGISQTQLLGLKEGVYEPINVTEEPTVANSSGYPVFEVKIDEVHNATSYDIYAIPHVQLTETSQQYVRGMRPNSFPETSTSDGVVTVKAQVNILSQTAKDWKIMVVAINTIAGSNAPLYLEQQIGTYDASTGTFETNWIN